ncbi:M14 family metallocarboxypeptidase [Alteromonas sp. ASW11-36]|uniref:M14 family metallocarboxypeptidase n=1 Tax=Alteromonas arenosi TaxID=3055817 RepID=A0ABT7SSM5_9ALTE|nr:M14 family metallocarboxypeptidase [Alteromonas sp. ASW11-36]MDM7859186.1 M14 family metallocarboxypeptidase [Alteromonas sp. ASW11-36]
MAYTQPVGTPGKPWGDSEKAQWLAQQSVQRSYADEVVAKLRNIDARFTLEQYGALPYDTARYPLYAAKSSNWQSDKPTILVTGGVHGYETSGVQGAIGFLQFGANAYLADFNFIVLPCISPWGYETINRWNPYALDPNRSFYPNSPAPESEQAMTYVAKQAAKLLAHFDLHETTDTDNTEFRPALADRDGTTHDNWNIPDGFYTVDDSNRPQDKFQAAVIASVANVTHIAPADEHGKIIGADVQQKGVIHYDKRKLFLCGGFTDAPYVTTTEVYPDSPKATPQQCIDAQIAAIQGGLGHLLSQR